jgi:hypothetical protein
LRREVAKDLTAAKEQYRVRKALGREANIEGKKITDIPTNKGMASST